ncbi:3-hydroxyisobutyryl-CoA hydrolase-like protein 2, mitochondrial [Hevea brasiliensis]|uniref:3-hydroxyisobutyryl-CoA hydrolase-like protein 2, mitochondrial n=1 Tax=Hevea brasiliensis TaxID=3981 RepID=UPI0025DB7BD0|nr:3-hydroxyisobutyryl-CoA hydrolase-like protein 2, mitochondrial [Hevea brasiliensis]
MQSLKAFYDCLKKSRFISYARVLSTINNFTALCDNLHINAILVEEDGISRIVILNRPRVLNALNNSMIVCLKELYQSWETHPDVSFVVLKGNGRAFCAGGDVVSVYRLISQGKEEECKEYFRTLYSFMYVLGTYSKPHVAILDGITMGGGAGISIHGAYRIATNKTIFAMPEVHIGFHPDVGSSYFLSRLPGHLGEYLALTGDTLSGEEMLACGLATHYLTTARLSSMEEQLGMLIADDFSDIETFLAKYADSAIPSEKSVLHRLELVNKCFGHGTVEEIVNALENETAKSNDEWCISTLKKLREVSPLSLKISLKSIQEGRYQTLSQCLAREYRMTVKAISRQISNDFCEGIRSRLVDKCFTPKWDPPCLEQVSQDMVNAYFAPLPINEPDLELPCC